MRVWLIRMADILVLETRPLEVQVLSLAPNMSSSSNRKGSQPFKLVTRVRLSVGTPNKRNIMFFTSDTHFWHNKIIMLAKRPFTDVLEMNETLIERWNNKVGKGDHVYHLGDFSFGTAEQTLETLKRLNGNIHLVLGNHDKVIAKSGHIKAQFASVSSYKEIKIADQALMLFHYPIAEWNKIHYGSWHLYGHVHGNRNIDGKALDVGIDGPLSNYDLLHFEEIKEFMKDRPVLTHH